MHPIQVGTKTNVGTVRSYKLVRYGYGKYRYFVNETEKSFGEDEIWPSEEKTNSFRDPLQCGDCICEKESICKTCDKIIHYENMG